MNKLLLITFLSPMVFGAEMEISSETPIAVSQKPLNPNAPEFKPRNTDGNFLSKGNPTLPSAPALVGKQFADVFSDLPKGVPCSPKASVLLGGRLKNLERGKKSLPRPVPLTIKFNLHTGSWEAGEFVYKERDWSDFYI